MVIDSHNTGAEAVCPFAIDAAQQSAAQLRRCAPNLLSLKPRLAETLPQARLGRLWH